MIICEIIDGKIKILKQGQGEEFVIGQEIVILKKRSVFFLLTKEEWTILLKRFLRNQKCCGYENRKRVKVKKNGKVLLSKEKNIKMFVPLKDS